jgi:ABC-type lipoprotein release transport system permease subunit
VKNRSLSESPRPLLYLPLLQDYRSNMILVARTSMNPEHAFHSVQTVVSSLDTGMPMFDVKTFEQHIGVSLFLQRMAATLLSIFGLLALSLAALGLYGVMAYSVSQRTHEVGVRMALGARPADVLRMVVGQAMLLVAGGLIAGVVAAAVDPVVALRQR